MVSTRDLVSDNGNREVVRASSSNFNKTREIPIQGNLIQNTSVLLSFHLSPSLSSRKFLPFRTTLNKLGPNSTRSVQILLTETGPSTSLLATLLSFDQRRNNQRHTFSSETLLTNPRLSMSSSLVSSQPTPSRLSCPH